MSAPLTGLVTDTVRSLGFLSRLPLSSAWFDGFDGRYDRAARTFPIAGAITALPGAATLGMLLAIGVPPLPAATVSLAVGIALTGALHEDGLADTADGLAGRTPAQRIAIMRDSAVGTYGIVALIVAFTLRVTALGSIVAAVGPTLAGLAIVSGAAASRGGMVWLWHATHAASDSGSAAASGRPVRRAAVFALASSALAVAACGAPFGWRATLAASLFAILVVEGMRRMALRNLGGHTGDVLGATCVLVEGAWLLGLASATA